MSQQPTHNLAATMAHWSARHRRIAIFGWLGLMTVLFALSFVVPMKTIVFETSGPGESGRAEEILYEDFELPAQESVLVESETLRLSSPQFRAVVEDVVDAVGSLDEVATVASPLDDPESTGLVSEDQSSALVQLEYAGAPDDAADKTEAVVAAVAEVQETHPDFYVGSFGESTNKALEESFLDDLKTAGTYSVPLTLIILLFAFGALVAAGIPLLLGLSAVLGTLGLVSLVSQVVPMDDTVSALVLLVGLAVGVDYSMFYLKREREERAAGRSENAALEAAAATSGHAVLVSGVTVIVAMSGMLLARNATFASFGLATMMVVAVAMLGSLTVLPALLSKLGDRVDRGRIPFTRRTSGQGASRMWGAITDRVLRRPLVSVVLAGGLLLALAVPALQMTTVQPGIDTFPQNLLTTYNRMQQAFPGTQIAADVVIKADDVQTPTVQGAITELTDEALATDVMSQPVDVRISPDQTVAVVSIPVAGDGSDGPSNAALDALRDDIVPGTVGALTGAEVAVTGMTAQTRDFDEQMASVTPLVFGFVLTLTFLLMLTTFRSVVIAVKSVVLNLLSVGAAYGVLVLVFQEGWGKSILGFETTGGIDPFLPVLLFVILFGLSMDYHVLILSRVREAYDGGMTTEAAVAHAIRATAGVITSAAIVMVGVFSIFGVLQAMIFKQFGVGLAAAILIDATLIRAVLLPAAMSLLGRWNWYLPHWLAWLPHLEHGRYPDPVRAPERQRESVR